MIREMIRITCDFCGTMKEGEQYGQVTPYMEYIYHRDPYHRAIKFSVCYECIPERVKAMISQREQEK